MPTLLAIETSSNVGSVCVLRDGTVFEAHVRDDAKLSAWVLPAIDCVLASASITLDDVDAIAFGQGPGSFTGVRTACATAQGIAYARNKPLYAIDTLAALARAAELGDTQSNKGKGQFFVILDARMNELYCLDLSGVYVDEPFLNSEVELRRVESLALDLEPSVYLGSGAMLLAERDGIPTEDIAALRERTYRAESRWSEGVARLALDQMTRGHGAIAPIAAQPRYVRDRVAQTEAERAAAKAAA
jgi:tRNA threonylcarbamoyladenosine biosynthesis protein TsaB